MDPDADPDPAIFVIDLQDANTKLILKTKFYCLLLFESTFLSFLFDDRRMTEGSGSTFLTNGSGSGRPKNMRIQWIRNTG
jgi:hypothetical protein